MLRLLADENLNRHVVRGLQRLHPEIDIVRVQDAGLSGATDPAILEWAAANGRIVISHDVNTLTKYAFERTGAGLPMPGVLEVKTSISMSQTIEQIWVFASCSFDGEWEGQVRYLPL